MEDCITAESESLPRGPEINSQSGHRAPQLSYPQTGWPWLNLLDMLGLGLFLLLWKE